MINPQIQNLVRSVESTIADKDNAFELTIASALATNLPIVISNESVDKVYLSKFYTYVEKFFDRVNETKLIDVEYAINVTKSIYKFRFEVANPSVIGQVPLSALNRTSPIKDFMEKTNIEEDEIETILKTAYLIYGQVGEIYTDVVSSCKQ